LKVLKCNEIFTHKSCYFSLQVVNWIFLVCVSKSKWSIRIKLIACKRTRWTVRARNPKYSTSCIKDHFLILTRSANINGSIVLNLHVL
jgi:hypothetical protein